jgi:hypothetical protein
VPRRNRPAEKSWATAYVTEQRQPHGVQGGGRWTAGPINPAARQAALVAQHQAAMAGAQGKPPAPAGGGKPQHDAAATVPRPAAPGKPAPKPPASKPAPPDREDQGERARARALYKQAAELAAQIRQLRADLAAVRKKIGAIGAAAGATTQQTSAAGSVAQQAKPGAAAGAATGGTSARSQALAALNTQASQIRAKIAALSSRRASLLDQARKLLSDARKSAPTPYMKGSRVAAIAGDVTKSAAAGGEILYFSVPIEKQDDTADINPADGTPDIVLTGKATDGTLDSDGQIVDPDASERWIRKWYDTKANVRQSHDPHKAVGRGLEIDGHRIKVRIGDPVAKHLIRIGALNDFSIGISNPEIRKGDPRFRHLDPMGKAVNGVITDRPDGKTGLAEISVVDRGANFGAAFQVVKAAADGTPEWTGMMTGPADVIAKASAAAVTKDAGGGNGTVTVELPADMRLRVSPAQLAKLATLKQRLVTEDAAKQAAADGREPGLVTKAGPVTQPSIPASPPAVPTVVNAAAEPDDEGEKDDDAMKAVAAAEHAVLGKKARVFTAEQRREHAGAGNALPDGSYPIPDADALRRAAILARSKHGDWKAASRLIARRARELGVPNPMKGGKKKTDKGAKPAVAAAEVCKVCKGTGTAGDRPCHACRAGKKMAKRMARKAAAIARADIRDALTEKKAKVMCPSCGAKQSRKHAMCSECGGHLAAAMPVTKNHDFTCLGCGKELDKGEPHCPGCGKENPGYLPEADHKIPGNEDKAAKGKKPKPGKKARDGAFGGRQAPPFGKPASDKDTDGDQAGKAARVAKGSKRKTPAEGVVGGKTKPVPRHREPDGATVETLEEDAGLHTGTSREKPTHLESLAGKAVTDPEVTAALRCKTLGVPLSLGIAHDLTCPAYHPADVHAAWPQASFKGLDLTDWQARGVEAAYSLPIDEAQKGLELWNAALLLKNADPFELADIREWLHKSFREVNPGPGHFPTPGVISPERFRRPYITEGRAAPSPGQDAPHHAKLPPMGGLSAEDYTRGLITAGHAADSPSNEHHASPAPPPAETGVASSSMARTFYRNTAREGARHAMSVLHDHISRTFPDLCPMGGADDIGRHPVPTPAGVADVTPAPGKKKNKAARAKARKVMARKRRRVESKVFTGKMTLEQARAKLGLEPVEPEAVKAASLVALPPDTPAAPALDPGAIQAAVAPLLAKMARRQDKAMRKQAKVLDAIAGQPDTSAAPFRGVATMRTPAAPAGPLSVTKSAQEAQQATYARMFDTWRNSEDPVQREAAWAQLRPYWDPNMHLNQPPPT